MEPSLTKTNHGPTLESGWASVVDGGRGVAVEALFVSSAENHAGGEGVMKAEGDGEEGGGRTGGLEGVQADRRIAVEVRMRDLNVTAP